MKRSFRKRKHAMATLCSEGKKFYTAVKDSTGTSALHRAAVLGTSGLITELLKLKASIDSQDEEGNTALMLAVAVTEVDAVKLLIEKGADINLKNLLDETALDIAKKSKNADIMDLLKKAMTK